jgi:hypothetical protein
MFFEDPDAWQSYDCSHTSQLLSVGYWGGTTDYMQQSIFFAPAVNDNQYHGIVLQYLTQGPFNDSNSWAAIDASYVGGVYKAGYLGAAADSQGYIYFAPYFDNNEFHGHVLRFDSRFGTVANVSGWSMFDVAALTPPVGFTGMLFDGLRYLYLTSNNISSPVLRYDTNSSFNESTSWQMFNPPGMPMQRRSEPQPMGFSGAAILQSRWIYFAPGWNQSAVLRYDSNASFYDSSSWMWDDMMNIAGPNISIRNFWGTCSSQNWTYFIPSANALTVRTRPVEPTTPTPPMTNTPSPGVTPSPVTMPPLTTAPPPITMSPATPSPQPTSTPTSSITTAPASQPEPGTTQLPGTTEGPTTEGPGTTEGPTTEGPGTTGTNN